MKEEEEEGMNRSQETRVVGVSLLHALEERPADATAKNKRKIDAGCAKDVLAVLADVLIADLAHVDAVVVQERAENAQCDHTPDAEDCAAHRACGGGFFSKR